MRATALTSSAVYELAPLGILECLLIRSRRPFFKSQPGKYLLFATLLSAGVTLVFPLTPLGKLFEFQPLPVSTLFVLGGVVGLYIMTAEVTKKIFYKSGLAR